METKKYYAEDMPTAMEQIKRELGADAIIVKSRKIKQKTGPLGLFRKTMYEVVVSCDPEPTPLRRREEARRERERERARKEAQREARTAEDSELLPVRQPEKAPAPKNAPARKDAGAPKPAAPQRPPQAPKAPGQKAAAPQRPSQPPNAAPPKGPRPPAPPVRKPMDGVPEEIVPPVEPERFAQLMRLSSADPDEQIEADMLEVLAEAQLAPQPAALTPQEKIRAYGNVNRKPDASSETAASAASSETAASAPIVPVIPAAPAAPTAATPAGSEAEQPVKRGRGRPRKYQSAEDARAAAAGAAAARRERERAAREEEKDGEMLERLSALERMVREMALRTISAPPAAPQPAQAGAQHRPTLSEGLEELLEKLSDQDVDRATIRALAERTRERRLDHPDEAEEESLRAVLRELLGRPRYIRAGRKKPRTIMFVGPTGVGKTTTLVKLASACVFDRHAKVGIINADVFRVGAQDQLSAYARILNVPLTTIYETEEIVTAIEELSELDFVFIDTSGKAPQDPEYQAELLRLMELGDIQEIYLTVSSTTSSRVCRQIAQEYDKLGDYRLAVTKLDESSALGSLANLCHASGRPLSYVTNGQNVPDDIQKADIDKIVDALLR